MKHMIQKQRVIALSTTLFLTLALAGCGGGGDEAAVDRETEQPAPVAATSEAAPTPEAAAPIEEITATPAEDVAAASDSVTLNSINEIDAVQSFRMRFTLRGTQAGEAQEISVEGEFTKQPPAERLRVAMTGGRVAAQSLETVVVDGARYTRLRNRWLQTPGDRFSLDEVAPLTPDAFTGDFERLEKLGEETLNGRTVTHYQLTKDALPEVNLNLGGQQRDLSNLENVQLNLWVDQEFGFISKLQASVEDAQSNSQFELVYEYYDINEPITIDAPDL